MNAFLDSLPTDDRNTLIACAIVPWFNEELLEILLDAPESGKQVQKLVSTYDFLAFDSDTRAYSLSEETRRGIAFQLKTTQPSRYFELHAHAFNYFVAKGIGRVTSLGYPFEDEMMYHLGELMPRFFDTGELERVESLIERVSQIRPLKQKHQQELEFYRGRLLSETHQYSEAQALFQALLLAKGLDELLMARTWTELGFVYEYLGFLDKSIQAHVDSGAIYHKLKDVLGESKSLNNAAIVYHDLGDYDKAYPLLKQSYSLAQKVNDINMQRLALINLGYIAHDLGEWDNAVRYYQECLTFSQQLELPGFVALIFNNLGELNHLLGKMVDAHSYFEQALAILNQSAYENKREEVDVLLNLGLLWQTQGQEGLALTCYEQAFDIACEIQHQVAISQAHYLIGTLSEDSGDLQKAHEEYEKSIQAIEQMREQVQSQETRIGLMGIRQYAFQSMILLCLKLNKDGEAFNYVERAKARAFLDQLGQTISNTKTLLEMPLGSSEIQSSLREDEVLIEYFITGPDSISQTLFERLPKDNMNLRRFLAPQEHILAFVLTRQIVLAVELQGDSRRIQNQFFNRHDGRLLGVAPIPGELIPPLGRWQSLDRQLLEPLRRYWIDKHHLFLIPYGILHYLPLHALSTKPSHWDRLTVSYAPSASILHKTCADRPTTEMLSTCLAVGVDKSGLLHSEAEARWIAGKLAGKALLGEDARISTVLGLLPQYRIVHFSCHGHFRQHDPLASGLDLADGELTAKEIIRSARLQAEMVVLAACDTGLNDLGKSDELFGLTRSFLLAGARSLLVSLWPVHEIPTRILMEEFYERWSMHSAPSDALIQAQQRIRTMNYDDLRMQLTLYELQKTAIEEHVSTFSRMVNGDHPFAHPYYWAAFLLMGNPQRL